MGLGEARARMLQRRAELLREAEENSDRALQLHGVVEPDWPDQAAGEAAEAVLASLSDRERREVLEIEAALRRMDEGRYGLCAACGGAIGPGRLEAIPEARLCLECVEREAEQGDVRI